MLTDAIASSSFDPRIQQLISEKKISLDNLALLSPDDLVEIDTTQFESASMIKLQLCLQNLSEEEKTKISELTLLTTNQRQINYYGKYHNIYAVVPGENKEKHIVYRKKIAKGSNTIIRLAQNIENGEVFIYRSVKPISMCERTQRRMLKLSKENGVSDEQMKIIKCRQQESLKNPIPEIEISYLLKYSSTTYCHLNFNKSDHHIIERGFLQKFIPGNTLYEVLSKRNKNQINFSLVIYLRIINLLFEALEFVHTVCFHRDLHSKNIIIGGQKEKESELVKSLKITIIDFDRSVKKSKTQGVTCGKVSVSKAEFYPHLAPECYYVPRKGEKKGDYLHTSKTDGWGIAVFILNLLYGITFGLDQQYALTLVESYQHSPLNIKNREDTELSKLIFATCQEMLEPNEEKRLSVLQAKKYFLTAFNMAVTNLPQNVSIVTDNDMNKEELAIAKLKV